MTQPASRKEQSSRERKQKESAGSKRDRKSRFALSAIGRFRCSQLFRDCRVADPVGIKVYDLDLETVLNLAASKLMQKGAPIRVMREVITQSFRKQDVARVPTIHDALGDGDPGAGYVCAFVYVHNLVHRAAVNTHSE